jgi:DNA-binding MarR family transcriptional regulator
MPKPSDPTVLAWTRLVRAHAAAIGRVQAALKAADLPPLEWYDVLLELEREGPMRPRDLQAKLLLAQYNLSRLLERMVEAGLVERAPCEGDGRGQIVGVSDEGRGLRRRMWPVYADAIEQAVGVKMSANDATTLAELLGRVAA